MNWLSFFGPIIAGVIVGLNNYLLLKFLFLHYEKSDSMGVIKKGKIKPIKIPKERISIKEKNRRINFYRNKQYLMENQYEN